MRIYDPKKILAPVDFSDLSSGVLRVASEIGENRNAKVVAIHVGRSPDYGAKYGGQSAELMGALSPSRLMEDARVELESNLSVMVREAGSSVPIESVVVFGDPAKEILGFCENGDFDLIVIGTHGRNMVSRFLIGSVSEQVIRRAPCPVFLLRDKVAMRRMAEIEMEESAGN